MLNFFKQKRHVTLVLGGGSARGIAHIGVLKVLEREKIPVDRIIGTSIGALVGAAYALGVPLKEMEEKACKFSWKTIFDPTIPKIGLIAGEKLEAVIKDITNNKRFEDCKIPFAIVTTDIEKNEEVVFQKGNLHRLIRASCSWPGIFHPVRVDGRLLVDGGVKHSVPTMIAKSLGPSYILAVDVGFCVRHGKITNIFQMMLQSFQIMGEELSRYQSAHADSLIKVELGDLDQVSFDRAKEAVVKGAEAAEAKVSQIKRILSIYNFPYPMKGGLREGG